MRISVTTLKVGTVLSGSCLRGMVTSNDGTYVKIRWKESDAGATWAITWTGVFSDEIWEITQPSPVMSILWELD